MSSLPGFPGRAPGAWGWSYVTTQYGTRCQDGILTSVQAMPAGDVRFGVTYSIDTVGTSNTISAAKFNDMIAKVDAERQRRGNSGYSLTLTNPISKDHVNGIKNALAITSVAMGSAYNTGFAGSNSGDGRYIYSYTANYDQYGNYTGSTPNYTYPMPDPGATTWNSGAVSAPTSDVAAGAAITAAVVNAIINAVKTAGSPCTCNCNYCTCNCNYCTCNCNYSCTCNCNYSDERLKENIKFIRSEFGINLYSWNYVWDKTKTYIGVLAQEILHTTHASAISTDANGYYMVDYSKLPVNMIEG